MCSVKCNVGVKYISIILYRNTTLKSSEHPIVLRITKGRVRKFINLNLSAVHDQWNEEFSQFKKDKRVNPDYEKNNAYINSQFLKAKDVIDEFDRNKIDSTQNQFEQAFLNRSKKGKVKPFFETHIQTLRNTGHRVNVRSYEIVSRMLYKSCELRVELKNQVDESCCNSYFYAWRRFCLILSFEIIIGK